MKKYSLCRNIVNTQYFHCLQKVIPKEFFHCNYFFLREVLKTPLNLTQIISFVPVTVDSSKRTPLLNYWNLNTHLI